MEMSRRVPSADLKLSFCAPTHHVPVPVPSSSEYGVAELTWQKGQLAMYGLNKPPTDTLESIVDQATLPHAHSKSAAYKVVPWLDAGRGPSPFTAAAMDALVPCGNSTDDRDNSTQVPGMGSCGVGSCSAAAAGCLERGGGGCRSYASASASDTYGGRDASLDSYDGVPTSTSLWSPENTSSGEDYTKTSGEGRDIVTQSRSQRQQAGDRGNRRLGIGKSSILAKSKAAAVHNQSERRRRDKINQRMKTLQKMVPNSSQSDKASMLGEVIEYMKQLQAQVGMMSRTMNMMMSSPMQLQMSMMAAAAMGMPMMPPAAAFMPMLPWDFIPNAFACQSQPMTMDAYSRFAANFYQQFQHSSAASASKN